MGHRGRGGLVEDELVANSGSGDVTARVAEAVSSGTARLNSGSGDIRLVVPANVEGTFDLATPALIGIAVEPEGSGGYKARGTLGSGSGKYKLAPGSGELRIELGNALPSSRGADNPTRAVERSATSGAPAPSRPARFRRHPERCGRVP